MPRNLTLAGLLLLAATSAAAWAQAADGAKDAAKTERAAKLKAGQEAAYRQYLPGYTPGIAPAKATLVTPKSPAAATPAAPGAPGAQRSGTTIVVARPPVSSALLGTVAPTAPPYRIVAPYGYATSHHDYRPNYNFNFRPSWWHDRDCTPFIFQPEYDARYRRSWPRPVLVRRFVPAHYLLRNGEYRYQPSRVIYETQYVVVGWPRLHYNGSHYSVSVSYR